MKKQATGTKRTAKDLQPRKDVKGGLFDVLANLASMRYETLKSIAQNIRS